MKKLKNNYRIIFICENDLSLPIGGTIHVREIINAMKKHLPNIILIAPDYHHKIIGDFGVRTIAIRTPMVRIFKWLYYYVISSIKLILLILKSQQKTIVYSREMPLNPLLAFVCKWLGIPLFIEINGAISTEMSSFGKTKVELLITKTIQNIIYQLSTGIITVSKLLQNHLHLEYMIPLEKITVIYNGVSVHLPELKNRIDYRSVFKTPTIRIVGFIGSCYPYHDITLLINIAPSLLAQIPNIRFVIGGDGETLIDWKRRVTYLHLDHYFYFPGYINSENIGNYISGFDICLSIFKKNVKGPGMKLFEYLVYNKPVIATYLTESFQLFQNLENIHWVEPENGEELFRTIIKVFNNLAKYSNLDSKSYILNNYTWDHTAQNIMKVIKETLCAA